MRKQSIPALVLAAALALSVPTAAAEAGTQNFQRTRSYSGQFSDLSPDSGFYPNVTALYEFGLAQGKENGTFGLKDHLTVGQVAIFAARIRSLYECGDAQAGLAAFSKPGQPLSEAAIRYLQDRNVVSRELASQLFLPASRAEVAHVLANVLPEEALPPIHQELVNEGYATHRIAPDVTSYTPYYTDILKLYRAGVTQGVDTLGNYRPNDFVTRGAASAMLTRMVDPALRVAPGWFSAAGTTLGDLVEDGTLVPAPVTPEDMDGAMRHMLHRNSSTLSLQYPSLTAVESSRLLNLALSRVKSYCEQSYNSATCQYTNSGAMTLTFSSVAAEGAQLQTYRNGAMNAAIDVHDRLWQEGLLTPSMTDREKAQVLYDWVTQNCTYDTAAGDDSLSHLPYSLFYTGKAVCDGYTGAYNLLLKLEDIPCTALSNHSHIWTVANLDGQEVHIDATWGDLGDHSDPACFAMTAEESWQLHPW